jgi:hypothetical protein
MKKFLDIIELIVTVLVILFLIWFGCSYFEVVSQNLNLTSVTLSEWNFFEWLKRILIRY